MRLAGFRVVFAAWLYFPTFKCGWVWYCFVCAFLLILLFWNTGLERVSYGGLLMLVVCLVYLLVLLDLWFGLLAFQCWFDLAVWLFLGLNVVWCLVFLISHCWFFGVGSFLWFVSLLWFDYGCLLFVDLCFFALFA